MTKYDIKNYLEKIYNIPVVDVRTRIAMGKFRRDVGKGYVIKDDDIKSAYVVLVSCSHNNSNHLPASGFVAKCLEQHLYNSC